MDRRLRSAILTRITEYFGQLSYSHHMKGIGRKGVAFLGGIAGMAVLLALLPSGAQANKDPWRFIAPKSADGVLEFAVFLELEDEADWFYDYTDQCSRTSGSGSHKITADLAQSFQSWTAFLPVKRVKGGKVKPIPTVPGSLLIDPNANSIPGIPSPFQPSNPQVGKATYTIDAAAPVTEVLSTTGECAPVGEGGDAPSDPPVWRCGTEEGTVKIEDATQGDMTSKVSKIYLIDSWTPDNPFNRDDRNGYCTDSALWAWSDGGFPAIHGAEGEQLGIEIQNKNLMGYFTINPKKRRKCMQGKRRLCREQASYVRTTKTLQRVESNEPGRVYVQNQKSVVTIDFTWADYIPLKER